MSGATTTAPGHGARVGRLAAEIASAAVAAAVAAHHGRWDGSGYPLGLAREDLRVAGRIIAAVDRYDGVVNPRNRARGTLQQGLAALQEDAGTGLDPLVVEEAAAVIARLEAPTA